MGADAILQAIAEETAHEVDRVLADARARARQRVKEATRAAQVRVDEAVAAVEPELRAEAARQVNVTRVELLHARARATAARLDTVYARAEQRLAEIAAADGRCWREALARMAQEALAATGPASTLAVRPADIEALEASLGAMGAVIVPEASMEPGLVARSADGRVGIDATLATRLMRARQLLAERLAALLEEGDVAGRASG